MSVAYPPPQGSGEDRQAVKRKKTPVGGSLMGGDHRRHIDNYYGIRRKSYLKSLIE